MAQQTINIGASPNDGTGTPLRTAFQYTNSNFSELYTAVGPSGNNIVVPGSATITGDLTVDTSTLKVDSANNRVGVVTATPRVSLDVASGDIYSSGQITWGGSSPTANQGFLSFTGGNAVIGSTGATALLFYTNGVERYNIGSTGISTWSVGGSTAMTLNSTGLGVGDAPAANTRLTLGSVNPTGLNLAFKTTGVTTGRVQTYLGNTSGDLLSGIEGSTAGQTLTGSAAYSGFIGTFTNNPFYLVSNGLIRATIDSSGNVGIGVTPSAWGATAKAIQIGSYSGIYNDVDFTVVVNNAFFNGTNNIYRNTAPASQYYQQAGSHVWRTAPSGTAGNAITFTQAMTLDASGNLLVGKSVSLFSTVGVEASGTGFISATNSASTNATTNLSVYSTGAAAFRFYVGLGGTVFATNTTISAISDARLKENVQDIDVGLGAILALKPRKFDWKAGKGKDIKGDRGFIAQEFEQVFPNLIDEWKDAAPEGEAPYKSVRQDLIPVLVKAIQELAARVQTLETR